MNDREPDKQDMKQEQPASMPISQPIQSTNNKSSLVEEYCRLLCGFTFEPIDQISLAASLLSENIKYSREHFQEQLYIAIEEYSSNYEAIKINVNYGFFCTSLYLINIDVKKTFSNSAESFTGAFGSVQKCLVDGIPFAVKSVKFEDDSFFPVFHQVVKECFLLKIASALQVGPNAKSIYGFDILAYNNCLDFSMQFCEPASLNDDPHNLKRSLSILHHFNIVHMDIKPENIAFSYHYNNLVFIDFGLSKSIKEEIGHKSYTNFIGSFIYCSSEMLSLYTHSNLGLVDLYFNDAHCLNLSLQKIKEIKPVKNQPQLFDDNTYISLSQKIIKQKFKLFILGSGSNFQFQNLQQIVSKMGKPILLNFILTLPQRINIIAHHKQLMRDKEENNEKLNVLNQKFESQSNNQIFKDRLWKISHMGNQIFTLERVEHNFQGLFDEEETAQYKLEVYCLALIRFIKVNSHQNSFQGKIAACKVFSRHYMKDQMAEQGIALYRKVVAYIFKLSMTSNQPQRYQILRQSIQTVAVLEIVPENNFIEAFFAFFDWDYRFVQKISLAFQFITTLQFIREKYRKTYNDERLLQVFMQRLNNFIDEVNSRNLDQQQKMIANDMKTMIDIKFMQNNQRLKIFLKEEKQYYSIQAKRLKKDMQLYLASYKILRDIDQLSTYSSSDQDIIISWILHNRSYSPKFIYGHLTIYHVFCCIGQIQSAEYIYQRFKRQFSPHQELTYFKIYYFHWINIMKLKLSLVSLQISLKCRGKRHDITQPSLFKCSEIFNILSWIIRNTDKFHYMLRYLLLNASQIERYIKSENIYTFLLANIEKIIKLTNNYHQPKKRHKNGLKLEISLFNTVLEFVGKYQNFPQMSQKPKIHKIIKAKITSFYQNINQVSCFQCKSLALYQIKNNFNFQMDAAKTQQNLLQVVQVLIIALKNHQLKQNIFPLIIVLIKASLMSNQLKQKYDFIALFYEYACHLHRHHHTLINISQCDLFLNIYSMIYYKNTPSQMVDFILNICESQGLRFFNLYIDNFYYSIVFMVRKSREKQKQAQALKQFHDIVAKGLLEQLKSNNVPYVAVYFTALLEFHILSGIQVKMLKFICVSLNSLNVYTKGIILNNYYRLYEYCMPISKRKKRSLTFKQFKNCFSSIPKKQILRQKTHLRKTRYRSDYAIKQVKLKSHIERYHENLENVKK